MRDFIGDGPHLKEGSPLKQVDKIVAPVLLFHGSQDENVGVAESRSMAAALRRANKEVTFTEFDGLDHYLDSADARSKMLQQSIDFFDTRLAQ